LPPAKDDVTSNNAEKVSKLTSTKS